MYDAAQASPGFQSKLPTNCNAASLIFQDNEKHEFGGHFVAAYETRRFNRSDLRQPVQT
jgi:hypothetical protein